MTSESAEPENNAPEAGASAPAAPAEAAAPASAPAEAAAPAEAHDGEGSDESGEGEEAAAEGGAPQLGPDGQPLKKRRRRRRGKKKPGEPGAEGAPEGGAQAEGAEGQPRPARAERPKRDPSSLPFSRYVGDIASRRGLFAPGEIVAGKVISVDDGVAVLDLFGKAFAFVAHNEPREIAAAHEPEPEHEEAPSAASDPQTVADAMAKLDGQVGMPASESLPPPPPVDLDGDGIPDAPKEPDTGEHPELSDPQAIAKAASALRHVGAPITDADGDGVPDDLELAGEHETSAGHENAHREEAPAEAEPESPPIELGSIFRGRIAAIADSGHLVLFNRKVARAEVRQRLVAARNDHRRVWGIVYGWNRGGFDVLVEGVRAFCPISGLSLGHVESPEPLVAQRLEFSVQQAKSGQQGIVVSRRGILEREAKKRAREMRKSLQVGQTHKGRVAAVRDFGLIVDLGGIEGLVHLSEVSWDRSKRPGDVASVGDEVDVKIIRIGAPDDHRGDRGGDRGGERGGEAGARPSRDRRRDARIGLSIKATQPHPFDEQISQIEIGSARKAKVMRVQDFGAFVELLPGLEGLLHVSELGRGVEDARTRLKEGEEIVVVIERVDPKARRIGLSMLTGNDVKLFEEGNLPQNAGGPKIHPGAVVKVRVEKVEPFGIIVQIDGVVGKRGRGFIPNIEMGTDKGTDHRKKFPPGTELEVKIIGVDRDGSLKCSKKALAVDEERKAVQAYRKEAATKGLGTFGDLLKKKLAKQGFTT